MIKTRFDPWMTAVILCVLCCGPFNAQLSGQSGNTRETAGFLTVKATGDVVPYSDFPAGKFRKPANYEELLDPVQPLLAGADIVLCNFEGPVTKYTVCSKTIRPGRPVFAFRYPPGITENLLKRAGFTVAHIANNHDLDFGSTGMNDTVRNLASAGITCTGFRDRITYRTINGIRTAMIGFNYFGGPFNDLHDTGSAVRLVKQARTNADIVIISLHAGAEGPLATHVTGVEERFHGEYRGNVREFSRMMVDQGADCVIGFGSHVLRGMEMYKGKIIAYSLGNFLGFGGALSRESVRSNSVVLELKMDVKAALISARLIPVRMGPGSIPEPASGTAPLDMVRRLSETDFPSSEMVLMPDGSLVRKQ
jgi:hypothetical protein